MQLIRQNPFHILGLLAGTNQRTIEKQKGKINAYQKVGKDIEFSEDLAAIGIPERTNGSIEKALSQIEINQNKVFHSLFWFVNLNHLDETALGYLRTGDIDKSLDIWEKVTNGKSVNDKNFGAFNNLGTLKLFSATQNDSFNTESFLEAVRLKTELIKSDSFNQFCHTVADETYSTDYEKELLRIISSILEDIKSNGLQSPKNLFAQISQIDPSIQHLLSEKVSDEPFHNIEIILDQTKKKRTRNPESGFSLARKLYTSTKDDFGTLADILGKSDPKYKLIADKLAKEILQCGVDYFQQYRDDEDEHNGDLGNDIMKLFKYANSIAVGVQTRERIEQNIEGLQEWIDSAGDREKQERIKEDLEFITGTLDSFQNKYESVSAASELVNSTKSGLYRIKQALGSSDELYLGISSAIVHNAQGMLVSIVNKEQEDFGHVPTPGQLNSLLSTVKQANSVMQSLASFDMVSDLRRQFNANRDSLNSILGQLQSIQARAQKQSSNSSSNSGCMILIAIGVIVGIIAFISTNSNNSSSSRSSSYTAPSTSTYTAPSTPSYDLPSKPIITSSKYKGNQLNNGDSPYNSVFGSGVYDKSVNNWVQFKNGNAHDVVICLVNVYSDRTIRNEYIRAGSTFQMTNIPNGTYYIKGFYGNDWNPYKKIDGTNIKGGFDTNFNFSKSDGYGDRLSLQDNGYQYSTYEVTLYSVSNGNMSQEGISQSEFFK